MHKTTLMLSCLLFFTASCSTPEKKHSSQSAAKERNESRSDDVPRPILKNRASGFGLEGNHVKRRNAQSGLGRGAIAVVKTARMIDMRYKLDLFENNSFAKDVAEILDKRDSSIRDCYTERVRDTPELKGTLTFAFRLSRNSPGFHALQRRGGSIKDPFLETCITAELQRIPLATYVSGRGILRYSFKVVSEDQTVEPVFGVAR